MVMPFVGDLVGMQHLAANLRRLTMVASRASTTGARKIQSLLRKQYRTGQDPYGNAWAALRPWTLRTHGPPPLTDTGAAKAGTVAKAMRGSGIAITIDAPYMAFHMTGYLNARTGTHVPARPVLPTAALPASWQQALKDAVGQAMGAIK